MAAGVFIIDVADRKDANGIPALLDVEADGEFVGKVAVRIEVAGDVELVLAIDACACADAGT